MEMREYVFKFSGGKIDVMAFNVDEARILAQAEAIKRGWNYTILQCIENSTQWNLKDNFIRW